MAHVHLYLTVHTLSTRRSLLPTTYTLLVTPGGHWHDPAGSGKGGTAPREEGRRHLGGDVGRLGVVWHAGDGLTGDAQSAAAHGCTWRLEW